LRDIIDKKDNTKALIDKAREILKK
jgi:hypothetical protein